MTADWSRLPYELLARDLDRASSTRCAASTASSTTSRRSRPPRSSGSEGSMTLVLGRRAFASTAVALAIGLASSAGAADALDELLRGQADLQGSRCRRGRRARRRAARRRSAASGRPASRRRLADARRDVLLDRRALAIHRIVPSASCAGDAEQARRERARPARGSRLRRAARARAAFTRNSSPAKSTGSPRSSAARIWTYSSVWRPDVAYDRPNMPSIDRLVRRTDAEREAPDVPIADATAALAWPAAPGGTRRSAGRRCRARSTTSRARRVPSPRAGLQRPRSGTRGS